MFVADEELQRLRCWLMCCSITLIVLGSLWLITAFVSAVGGAFILGVAGGVFTIITGAVGLTARNANNLPRANRFKICLIILLAYECVNFLILLIVGFIFVNIFVYLILPLIALVCLIAFLAYSIQIASRFVQKLRELLQDHSGFMNVGDPIQVGGPVAGNQPAFIVPVAQQGYQQPYHQGYLLPNQQGYQPPNQQGDLPPYQRAPPQQPPAN